MNFQYMVAFLWGFAEATFFFILPDVYLTRLAVFNGRTAFKACIIAAIAACIGGSLMYAFSMHDSGSAYRFLSLIPAITPTLIEQVNTSVQAHPFYALFVAPFKGIPYKIYAVAFGAERLSFLAFLGTSFVARLFRFFLTTSIAFVIIGFLRKYFREKTILIIHGIIWLIIYLLYFHFITKV